MTWYISNDGNDSADGKTPDTAFRTFAAVTRLSLEPGDQVEIVRLVGGG